jgi:LacI family transcriptional regulator
VQISATHNSVAASLRRRSTRTIGLVVLDIRNTFFAKVVEALEAAASAAGYSLFMIMCAEDRVRRACHSVSGLRARERAGSQDDAESNPDPQIRS